MDDVMSMVKKLGININKEEARVLLLSADVNADNVLDLEEFHELIFSNNEALNIDLSRVPVSSDDSSAKNLMANLQETIKAKKEQRENEKLQLFVQKQLNNIAKDLLNLDEAHLFVVSEKDFRKVLKRRLQLPEKMKNDTARFDKFVQQYIVNKKVNYKDFMDNMRGFSYSKFDQG